MLNTFTLENMKLEDNYLLSSGVFVLVELRLETMA